MPRSRIEGLLASFPKLIGSTDQHTFVETDSVRYVYQPLEELYMVLITNKQSNILQDIDTLHLFGRVVSEYCRTVDEREVSKNAFSLLSVFDEIISSGGFKEDVTLSQIRTITEMESHEERVQAEIEKRKEKEAKDELNRKARAMESQKREMQKKGYVSSPNSGGFGANYGGNFNRSYTSEPSTRYEETKTSSYSQKSTPAPTGLARGMQLGKKQKDSALIDQVRTDEDLVDLLEKTTLGSSSSTPGASVQKEGIHVAVEERVTVKANRDGGLENMEIKGKLTLTVSDPAKGLIRLSLKNPQDSNTQFQTHPQIDKKLFSDDNILGLKDSSRPFPLGQALGILKWRYVSKDESSMPIAINCWPSPSGTGSCDVNIEYELQSSKLELRDVVITIPYPGSTPPTVKDVEGHYQIDRQRRTIEWKLPIIDETNKVGLLEFSVESEDVGAFYPISANFTSNSLYLDVEIDQVYFVANQDSVSFSKETLLAVDEYTVT
ncbi:Coatomer subunit delta [Nowakowskiella sp. JEL0407]|nr:Coatomer subunit delta [Nowakowskiella sp. JEL0407]